MVFLTKTFIETTKDLLGLTKPPLKRNTLICLYLATARVDTFLLTFTITPH